MRVELLGNVKNSLVDRAKAMRKTALPAEVLLWNKIRSKQISGFKFRRQQPLDNFIVDFFCAQARLVIELDGESHQGEQKQKADIKRQNYLEDQGFKVLRFTNEDVYKNLNGVLEEILMQCQNISSTPPLAPPARGGVKFKRKYKQQSK